MVFQLWQALLAILVASGQVSKQCYNSIEEPNRVFQPYFGACSILCCPSNLQTNFIPSISNIIKGCVMENKMLIALDLIIFLLLLFK